MVAGKPDPKREALADFQRRLDEMNDKAMRDFRAWASRKITFLTRFLIFNLVLLMLNIILYLWR